MAVRIKKLNKDIEGVLRRCQRKGFDQIRSFVNSAITEKACLMSLPTGSGKTGIMASICAFCSLKRIMVICHRDAIRNQLFSELKGNFFKERSVDVTGYQPEVFKLKDDTSQEGVYVTTFQKLDKFNATDIESIQKNVDLILVDEGHAEPAAGWSKIVRGFSKYKIIFTATPYRNDLFQFNINDQKSFLYTFSEALEDKILCGPVFEQFQKDDLIQRIQELLTQQPGTKCIIKCRTYEDVESYRKLFRDEFKTAAYHERYKGKNRQANTSGSVPKSLRNSDYQLLIHQRKLDEGVDIPQTKILVLTYPVASGRELVQSVGRIVRLHDKCRAYVLDLSNGSNEALWNNFKKFDRSLSTALGKKKFLQSLDTVGLIETYIDNFPAHIYAGSKFRKKFDFLDFNPKTDLQIPSTSVCFLNKKNGFTLARFFDALKYKRGQEGELVKQYKFGSDCLVLLSVCFKNSPFLTDSLFFEPTLHVTIVKEVGALIGIYDSRSKDFSLKEDLKTGLPIGIEQLQTLAARSSQVKTKALHTRSIGTSFRRPDSISYRGKNLEDISQSQTNATSAITRMQVENLGQNNQSESAYYLGVKHGRVSDQKRKDLSLVEFGSWVDDICGAINSSVLTQSNLINSYSKPITVTPDTKVLSVLFDFTELGTEQKITHNEDEFVILPDFIFCPYSSGLKLPLDGGSINFQVSFSKTTSRLEIALNEEWVMENGDNFADWITENQNFKALYKDGVSYADGLFYKQTLPTEEGFDLSKTKMGNAVIGLAELNESKLTEKGTKNSKTQLLNSKEFHPNSVFYIIDKLRHLKDPGIKLSDAGPFAKYIADAELLVCTDMGPEPADFIVASEQKICFVHVKCGKANNPEASAGGLAEVGGQSIKNLEYLITKNEDLPFGNNTHLMGRWPSPNHKPGLDHRVRMINKMSPEEYMKKKGKNSANEVMEDALKMITEWRVSDAVEKEIWLVVGRAFSKQTFIDQIQKGAGADSKSLQAFQLLDEWISTSASYDVGFKAFVSP